MHAGLGWFHYVNWRHVNLNKSLSREHAQRCPSPRERSPLGVLVVDDDLGVRTLLTLVLRQQGFEVWPAADGAQAIREFLTHSDHIALVVLDVQMPGMDGPMTLARLVEIDPHVCCWFMTGDSKYFPDEQSLRRGVKRVLRKPFSLAALRKLFQQWASGSSQ